MGYCLNVMIKHCVRTILTPLAVSLAAVVVLTGCSTDEVVEAPQDDADEQVVRVGVVMSAPGLVSGTDPEQPEGIEIELATQVMDQLDIVDADARLEFVPVTSATAAQRFASDDLSLVIGQLSGVQPSDQLAWVGPYLEAAPAMLRHSEPDELEADEGVGHQALDPVVIDSVQALEAGSVCVVEGSLAQGLPWSFDDVTLQQTVSECVTGMRSHRYDAVLADDVQLAGVLWELGETASYEMLAATSLVAADEDAGLEAVEQIAAESGGYWLGTVPAQCHEVTESLAQVVGDEQFVAVFEQWAEVAGVSFELVDATDVSSLGCEG